MGIVSYRIYCDECNNESVIRKDLADETHWTINSWQQHSGICPACNDSIEANVDDFDDSDFEVDFTQLRGIGAGTQDNLHEAGIVTRGDIRNASDEELSSITGVGSTSLASIRDAV